MKDQLSKTPLARLALSLLGLGLFLAFVAGIRGILLPFVVGLIVAYFLAPSVELLHRRARLPRWLGAAVAISGLLLLLVGIAITVMPIVGYQVQVFATRLPLYIAVVWSKAEALAENFQSFLPEQAGTPSMLSDLAKIAHGTIMGVFTSALLALNIAALLLITPVVGFYMLKDWDKMKGFFDSLVPAGRRKAVKEILDIIDKSLAGFLRGQLLVCSVLAVYYAICLSVLRLDIAVAIGMMTGFLIFVPYVGWALGFLAAMGVAVAQFSDPWRIAAVAGVYLFGMALEGWFMTPRLVGSRVGLHPVAVMFALFAGGALAGFLGVVVAVPVAAVIAACLRLWLEKRRAREGGGAAPR
ncbi:AI-2E family transporter [Alphaproteobacteria bacterium]|nr:AI-2E family transporter [Alphaproteobacteria bacterium]